MNNMNPQINKLTIGTCSYDNGSEAVSVLKQIWEGITDSS